MATRKEHIFARIQDIVGIDPQATCHRLNMNPSG